MRWWCMLWVGLVLFSAGGADARVCGADVECGCGDQVVGHAILEEDLLDCPADGLRLRKNATLDCAGHAITGLGDGSGITLDHAHGAVVSGCHVAGFRTGLRLRGGGNNRVLDNEFVANTRYGIEFALGSVRNLVDRNLVLDSGDEGIHVGSGADWNLIMRNDVRASGSENIYLLDVRNVLIIANMIAESRRAAVYMKHATNSALIWNTIEDRVVHVRGASNGNTLAVNHLVGAGFVFEAYEETRVRARVPLGWSAPTGNRILGGTIRGASTCFRFAGASGNTVKSVQASGCRTSKAITRGGKAATANHVNLLPLG